MPGDNFFLTVDWVKMEMMRDLVNQLEILQFFNTDANQDFNKPFAVGTTIKWPLPERHLVQDGMDWAPPALDERFASVTMSENFGVQYEYTAMEKAISMGRDKETLKKRYITSAAKQLAQESDLRGFRFAGLNTNNTVGVLGTQATTMDPYADARTRLKENCGDDRGTKNGMIISSDAMGAAVKSGQAIFNPSDEIGDQYRKGVVGMYGGWTYYESNNTLAFTTGSRTASITINGSDGGSDGKLVFNCTSGDTFKKGEWFTIAAVNNVDPAGRQSTVRLKNIVITADVTATAVTVAVPISPSLDFPGSKYQNVDSAPVNGAAVTLNGGVANATSGRLGLGLNDGAFALVSSTMEKQNSLEACFIQRDPKTGLSFFYGKQFDLKTMSTASRLQMLMGFGALYPDNCAVRVASLR